MLLVLSFAISISQVVLDSATVSYLPVIQSKTPLLTRHKATLVE
jgi:hypothetical protein